MTSEIPATPEPAAEPAPQATPPAQAEPTPAPVETKQESSKPPVDYEKAYKGLQPTVQRLHSRVEDVLGQNVALAGVVQSLKSGQHELVRATLGEDKAREMASRDAQVMAQEASRRAATAAQNLMEAQAEVLISALDAAGISRDDPAIDWANNAGSVDEWKSRVTASVKTRITKANEDRIANERKTLTAKSQQEIRAEAEALTQRTLKEQGVDRIDTAKGQASTNFVDRVRTSSDEDFKRMIEAAKSGRLRI